MSSTQEFEGAASSARNLQLACDVAVRSTGERHRSGQSVFFRLGQVERDWLSADHCHGYDGVGGAASGGIATP